MTFLLVLFTLETQHILKPKLAEERFMENCNVQQSSKDVGGIWIRPKELDKLLFEEYTPKTRRQQKLKEDILKAIGAGLADFEVYIQSRDDKARNAYELDDWAKSYSSNRNSRLGTTQHYNLYLAQKIQNGKPWEEVCDKKDISEAFRQIKEGRFSLAGGCMDDYNGYPESDVYKGYVPSASYKNIVAFVVLS
jgi:hypothetical protein